MNNFFQNQPQYTPEQIKQFQQQAYYAQIKTQKKQQLNDIMKTGFMLGSTIVAFLLCQTIGVSALYMFGLMDVYKESPLFQNSANIIIVHFFATLLPFLVMASTMKKHFITPVLPIKKTEGKSKWAWYGLGIGGCMLANYVVGIIMVLVKDYTSYELTQMELDKPNTLFACIITIFSTAIVPGICEEIAYRGCAMGILRKYGKGFTVIAVSLVFGLVHGNIIQFLFAFLVGIILAYITIQTDNILIAMCVHATNNALSVIQDIMEYLKLGDYTTGVTSAFYLCFAAAGIISVIYLAKNKKLKPAKEEFNPCDNPLVVKLLALAPGLIVPFSFLIYSTVKTIVKQ